MLEIFDLSYHLPTFSLKSINLKIEKGEYWVILGESGSGKSLLLDLIAGFRKPSYGKILKNQTEITNVPIYKRKFSYVTASNSLFPHLTVEKNLKFQSKLCDKRWEEIVEWFQLKKLLKKYPQQISSGETQRVALARAIASEPEILLLDEPLSSVDVAARYEIMLLLRQLHRKGNTIIHVTHDFQEALVLSEKVAVMQAGKILQTGSIAELTKKPANAFVAKLTGIKNVYQAFFVENDTYRINENISIITSAENHFAKAMIILSSNDVILSNEPLKSSMQNSINGIVIDILQHANNVDVVVDAGITIHATITMRSLNEMNIIIGKKIWVNFKASAVTVIPASDL